MREILFRGKRSDNKEWVEGYGFCDEGLRGKIVVYYDTFTDEEGEETHYYDFVEVITETIGEYTGLCDKNGTRIFEGDIIKINGLDGDYLFEVKFGKCGGVQNVVHDVGYIGFYLYPISKSAKECENFGLRNDILYWINRDDGIFVVGNIHDNPELLENSQNFS